MITRNCDLCGAEIPDDRKQVRIVHKTMTSMPDRHEQVTLELKIVRALNGTWNYGDVCTPCIREAVEHGKATTEPASD